MVLCAEMGNITGRLELLWLKWEESSLKLSNFLAFTFFVLQIENNGKTLNAQKSKNV